MKRFVSCFVLVLVLFIIGSSSAKITGETITGEAITGSATQSVGLNITVLSPVPEITLHNPKNHTYFNNISMLLNFTATNARTVWYNLDHSANNTVTTFIYFNSSSGGHTLYLFANNSNGTVVSKNVSFSINNGFFNISFGNFSGSKKGNSSNFNIYSFEDLQNLSEVIFENTDHGRIFFKEAINFSVDSNASDFFLNIDKYLNISSNRIEIDSRFLSNFNESATLTLYNLSLTDPVIKIDGSDCPSTICTEQSYSGGNLIFNVAHFTAYYAEEYTEVSSSPSTSGGSSGSGGSGIYYEKVLNKSFSIDRERISLALKNGETESEKITIKNNLNKRISFSMSLPSEIFFVIREKKFDLEAGESREIIIDFFANEDLEPDIYTGKIIIKGDNEEKEVLVALEIESNGALFDVEVKVPDEFLAITNEEDIVANIRLFEVESVGKVDVEVFYRIIDSNGKTVYSASESLAVEGQINYIKLFDIPGEIDAGVYNLYIKVRYGDNSASASKQFLIIKKDKNLVERVNFNKFILILIVSLLIILILAAIYIMIRLSNITKKIKNIKYYRNYKNGER